jgi:ribulose-5-phosphate 4-epimerase/fuculose-1-phosphate aldolase
MSSIDMTADPVRAARIDLAAAHRLAVFDNLNEGSWNHFSVAVPGAPGRMLVTPAGRHWRQVTASNLVLVDRDGTTLSNGCNYDSAAYNIHHPIHEARKDAFCVLHAHPPYATALSMVGGGRLEMADQNALALYGRVAYDDVYDGFIFDGAQSRRLVDMIGDARVLFMRNHGVLVVGPTVAEAYTDLYQLERACQFQHIATTFGGKLREVDESTGHATVIAADESGYKLQHFAAMKLLLDAEQPDYLS